MIQGRSRRAAIVFHKIGLVRFTSPKTRSMCGKLHQVFHFELRAGIFPGSSELLLDKISVVASSL